MKELLDQLENKLEVLKKNTDYCGSREELKKKYPKGYQNLEKEINKLANQVSTKFLLMDVRVLKKDASELKAMNSRAKQFAAWLSKEKKWKEQLRDALFTKYSIDAFLDALSGLHPIFLRMVYAPYFKKCTTYYKTTETERYANCHYYNHIYKAWFDEKKGIWVDEDGEVFVPTMKVSQFGTQVPTEKCKKWRVADLLRSIFLFT